MPQRILTAPRILMSAQQLVLAGQVPTFSRIARELGTHSQALYPYFKNQQVLAEALFDQTIQELMANLTHELVGFAGRPALARLAQVSRQYCLERYRLFQYILTIPNTQRQSPETGKILREASTLMHRLLAPWQLSLPEELTLTRTMRNLIIGEVLNEGAGWFDNPAEPAVTSFQTSVDWLLAQLPANP